MNEREDTQPIRLEAVFLIYLLGGGNPEDLLMQIEQRLNGIEQLVGPWIALRDDAA